MKLLYNSAIIWIEIGWSPDCDRNVDLEIEFTSSAEEPNRCEQEQITEEFSLELAVMNIGGGDGKNSLEEDKLF